MLLFGKGGKAYHVAQSLLQTRGLIGEQPLGDVGISLVHNRKFRVAHQSNALQDADSADDERKVYTTAEAQISANRKFGFRTGS